MPCFKKLISTARKVINENESLEIAYVVKRLTRTKNLLLWHM